MQEVKRELPQEVERFVGIDKIVREVLAQCASIKNVVKLCNTENLLKRLQALQTDLNICEKALADYLESTLYRPLCFYCLLMYFMRV